MTPQPLNLSSLTPQSNPLAAFPTAAPLPAIPPAGTIASALPSSQQLNYTPAPSSMFSIPKAEASMVSNPTPASTTTPTSGATPEQLAAITAQVKAIQDKINASTFNIPSSGPVTSKTFSLSNNSANYLNATNGGAYDSSQLTPGQASDLQEMQRQKMADMTTGTDPSLIPSDNLYGQIANSVYQSSLYTPEEQSAISGLYDIKSQIEARNLAEKRQIQQLQENGNITQQQSGPMVQEAQRRANQELADLAVQQNSAANTLSALGMVRGNQLTGLQNLAALIKPEALAPGSTLYSNVTGPVYQGSGAAPAQLLSAAQTLFQNDQATGVAHYTPQGGIDENYYYQQAQQMLGGGGTGGFGGTSAGGAPSSGGQSLTPSSPDFAQSLPAIVYPAFRQTSTGMAYLDQTNLDTTNTGLAKQISQQYGIPILPTEDVKAVQSADQAIKNLDLLEANFKQLASKSGAGAIISNLTDPFSSVLQTQYGQELNAYNANRGSLIQQVRALAGSSPRLSQMELSLEGAALPTLSEFSKDSLGQGIQKLQITRGLLSNALSALIPNSSGQSGKSVGGTFTNTQTSSISGSPFDPANFYGQ